MRIIVLGLVALISLIHVSRAAEPKTELLWPKGAPGAKGDSPNDKPYFDVFLPEKAKGAAIVVCPGGGYGGLAKDHEGRQIGNWLNSLGITAFVLDYRHKGKGYEHPAPMQDVQRALRTVRARADEWKVDAKRVGILGFSAGGHLASTAATHFDAGNDKADDAIEKQSCRPDFAILCYPVIAFGEPFTHYGSQRNLLGNDASPELIKQFSNEKQVTKETPPTFLWITTEDKAVPPENAVVFYLACRKAGVPAELHVYEKGQHGVGLGGNITGTNTWPTQCANWLTAREIIPAAK